MLIITLIITTLETFKTFSRNFRGHKTLDSIKEKGRKKGHSGLNRLI